jgi:hypothetical protein
LRASARAARALDDPEIVIFHAVSQLQSGTPIVGLSAGPVILHCARSRLAVPLHAQHPPLQLAQINQGAMQCIAMHYFCLLIFLRTKISRER